MFAEPSGIFLIRLWKSLFLLLNICTILLCKSCYNSWFACGIEMDRIKDTQQQLQDRKLCHSVYCSNFNRFEVLWSWILIGNTVIHLFAHLVMFPPARSHTRVKKMWNRFGQFFSFCDVNLSIGQRFLLYFASKVVLLANLWGARI